MTENAGRSTGPEERFVGFLRALERAQNRGALAALRRCAGRPPTAEALRLIVPYLPESQPWKHEWYFLVGGLFGMHPEAGGRGNLGETFRQLGDHGSAQKRFTALLDSSAEDLPHRLRQAINLARSKDAPVDWLQLLQDMLNWQNENRIVQFRWASAYWHERAEQGAQG